MAGREIVRKTVQQVRPILSVDSEEARRRVLSLYKAWYRQIPYVGEYSGVEVIIGGRPLIIADFRVCYITRIDALWTSKCALAA